MIPVNPPGAWFRRPANPEQTGIRITADGHMHGYVLDWSSCHISFRYRCRRAPRSRNSYAFYATRLMSAPAAPAGNHVVTE